MDVYQHGVDEGLGSADALDEILGVGGGHRGQQRGIRGQPGAPGDGWLAF